MMHKLQPREIQLQEVECECGFTFCWRCNQEAHFPSSCYVAKRWNQRISFEYTENMRYILTKCKQCPKCHIPIEFNGAVCHETFLKHKLKVGVIS